MASSHLEQENVPSEAVQDRTTSNAVEMRNLDVTGGREPGSLDTSLQPSEAVATSTTGQQETLQAPVVEIPTHSTTAPISTSEATQVPASESAQQAAHDRPADSITDQPRFDSMAIGPSTDPTPAISTDAAHPVCIITLLLTSGARHPYKLDEKYLAKRNVDVPGVTESGRKDPFSISVYTLKELILREWRDEWDPQPSSPSSIRLIHFGRLLDDKIPLKECRFNSDTPNVVHMTVKPQDIVDDEEASKGKSGGRDRDGVERTAGCSCVIL